MEETVVSMKRSRLRHSPLQYRKSYNEAALRAGAETMKQPHGRVHQPIVARPLPEPIGEVDHEIVFGHQREIMAGMAGLDEVPTIVRDMTDEQVRLAQLVENMHRQDTNAVEEADALATLRREHNTSIEALMEKTGKSRTYIFNRLKLADAMPVVRQAVVDEVISAAVGELLARVPASLQVKAFGEVTYKEFTDGQYVLVGKSYRKAKSIISARYHLQLDRAPFDVLDMKLVPAAAACDGCPKNSTKEPALAEELGAGVCTDPDCYEGKIAAYEAKQAAQRPVPSLVVTRWPFPQPAQTGTVATPRTEGQADREPSESRQIVAQGVDVTAEDDELTYTPEQRIVQTFQGWQNVLRAIMRCVRATPRTTDDLRLLALRELDANYDFGLAEEVLEWHLDDARDEVDQRRDKIMAMSPDELAQLLVMNAIEDFPYPAGDRVAAKLDLAARYGVNVLNPDEPAPTPSTAARAREKKPAKEKGEAKGTVAAEGPPLGPGTRVRVKLTASNRRWRGQVGDVTTLVGEKRIVRFPGPKGPMPCSFDSAELEIVEDDATPAADVATADQAGAVDERPGAKLPTPSTAARATGKKASKGKAKAKPAGGAKEGPTETADIARRTKPAPAGKKQKVEAGSAGQGDDSTADLFGEGRP